MRSTVDWVHVLLWCWFGLCDGFIKIKMRLRRGRRISVDFTRLARERTTRKTSVVDFTYIKEQRGWHEKEHIRVDFTRKTSTRKWLRRYNDWRWSNVSDVQRSPSQGRWRRRLIRWGKEEISVVFLECTLLFLVFRFRSGQWVFFLKKTNSI